VFVPPKTHRSARKIPLPGPCLAALREHEKHQDEERRAAGERWQETGLVFTTGIGTPIEPRNLNRTFTKLCDDAGIRRVRLHDLRHMCATILRALGVDARVIMEVLGHSQISVTMNIYTHVDLAGLRAAMTSMGGVFPEPRT
jgi:integrase